MAKFSLYIGDARRDRAYHYDKTYIDDFSCTSQISTDATSINYGIISGKGDATMRDYNDTIKERAESGGFKYFGQKTRVLLNDGDAQELITSDSAYNVIDKTLHIDFKDRLSTLDDTTYNGMPLRDYKMNAYDMLDDVIGSYGGYVKGQVINWKQYFKPDLFTIWADANGIECNTADGWEIIGTPIKVTPYRRYFLYVDIGCAKDYTTAIPLQILNAPPTESSCENLEIARLMLPTIADTRVARGLQFTPTTDTIYLVLNFGYADDGQQVMISVNHINLDGNSLENSTQNPAYVPYGTSGWWGNVQQLLSNIEVEYPYLERASYRATIEKFCNLAQLTASLNNEGKFVFSSVRPIRRNDKHLSVSRNYQISNLNKTLFIKNAYDGVKMSETQVTEETQIATNIANPIFLQEDVTVTREENGLNTNRYIRVTYWSGNINIPKKSNNNKETITRVRTGINASGNTNISSLITGFCQKGTVDVLINPDVTPSTRYIRTYGEKQDWVGNIETFEVSFGSLSASLENKTNLGTTTAIDMGDWWQIPIKVAVGEEYYYYDISTGKILSEATFYAPQKLEISVLGDKHTYIFSDIDVSTDDIVNAKAPVNLQHSELLQSGTKLGDEKISTIIKNNVLSDYENGVQTATIDLFCGVKSEYDKGEIIQPNDMLKFADDDNLWRVTSRTLKYKGSPTVSLELMATQYY